MLHNAYVFLTTLFLAIPPLVSLTILAYLIKLRRLINHVRVEVTTANGKTMAMLADAAEGRRAGKMVAVDRSDSEQHAVERFVKTEEEEHKYDRDK